MVPSRVPISHHECMIPYRTMQHLLSLCCVHRHYTWCCVRWHIMWYSSMLAKRVLNNRKRTGTRLYPTSRTLHTPNAPCAMNIHTSSIQIQRSKLTSPQLIFVAIPAPSLTYRRPRPNVWGSGSNRLNSELWIRRQKLCISTPTTSSSNGNCNYSLPVSHAHGY
jgi:hypothetical protein